MEPKSLKKLWHVIKNADAAQVLSDPAKQRYLLPFIREELSLSEAAHHLGVKPNALLYQINKLLNLGLLEVVRVKQRQGRASKIYRAIAQRFFIPFSLTKAETVQNLAIETDIRSERLFQQDLINAQMMYGDEWGIAIYIMEDGSLSIDLATSIEHTAEDTDFILAANYPAVWSSWLWINLSHSEAKMLQQELIALWQRYKQMRSPDKPKYTLRLGLAPMNEFVRETV
ncbi:MAG: helix-turn-helix domain-containing protein [Deinococcota bacterium]